MIQAAPPSSPLLRRSAETTSNRASASCTIALIAIFTAAAACAILSSQPPHELPPKDPAFNVVDRRGRAVIISDAHVLQRYNASYGRSCRCAGRCGPNQTGTASWQACPDSCLLPEPGSPFGQYGCDGPPALVKMAFREARRLVASPDFVLYLGCMSGHDMPNLATAMSNLRLVRDQLHALYEGSVISCPVIGNNDVFEDYEASLFRQICDLDAAQEARLPPGRLGRLPSGPRLRLVAINTNLYSAVGPRMPWNAPWSPSTLPDPRGQLEQQLAAVAAAGERAYIAGHLPPTLDSFRREPMWNQIYADRFFAIVRRQIGASPAERSPAASVIDGLFFSHLHSDEFRLIPGVTAAAAPIIHIISSVTPIYGGNPTVYEMRHAAAAPAEADRSRGVSFRPVRLTQHAALLGDASFTKAITTPAAFRAAGISNGDYAAVYRAMHEKYHSWNGGAESCSSTADRLQTCATCTNGCRIANACLYRAAAGGRAAWQRCVDTTTLGGAACSDDRHCGEGFGCQCTARRCSCELEQ
ncbi:hypothetical protein EMIHUDRAFT_221473 [Emiliania huxleyi CCMP1516]|uniref:Calcineurin-like phosphoesterase domain-containing protein n=2 Tax=Emiliania huxleyi TaxID=2903 RepID=A0A0D3HYG8_EMIH1|nr:hypothetical protein EMIHUDRAFT_221473 [Emiliania huxleyi CCMP1516]EOD04053.1 hypothetical protein EMIHUDRAFT_221473 [Emiliania huxleyi CCMP1516]|eukprot:XP_005756482.1 hypothetical protein EMIHUDRAFT_221473 [Emiliania huxleyi CCMP1516]